MPIAKLEAKRNSLAHDASPPSGHDHGLVGWCAFVRLVLDP